MSIGKPTAQAFRFVLDGQNEQYDAYMDLVEHQGFSVLDVRYKPQSSTDDKWTFLTAPEFYTEETNTEQDILAEFQRLLNTKINPKIEEVFGGAGEKPLKGWELVQWIVSVGLVESNNVISLK